MNGEGTYCSSAGLSRCVGFSLRLAEVRVVVEGIVGVGGRNGGRHSY